MYEVVTEGQVLAGKYRVERVLGEGGMGVVVAARHLQLDERVALKFMRPEALTNSDAVARFAREARAAVKIKSEHVARVSDVGTLENGAPYMVMEYLEGGDLSSWVKHQGSLPLELAVDFVLQASEAIAEAHALGIVHRDLKPANLFVIRRPDGAWSVKVLDFGISKMTGLSGSGPDFGMTKTSAVMGSPHYMSPEQMRSVKDADARSDIWSLGVIMYELLAGVTPFTADAYPELVLKIASEPPAPLRNRAPHVPLGIEQVILRCLDKDPANRFATVGELAVALLEFAPPSGSLSVERISGVLKAAGIPTSSNPAVRADGGTGASWGKTSPGNAGGKRALVGGAAILILAALGLGGYALLNDGSAAKPAASVESLQVVAPTVAASPELPNAALAATPASATSTPASGQTPPASASNPLRPPAKGTTPAQSKGGAPVSKAAEPPTPTKPQPAAATPAPPAPPSKPSKNNVFDER